MALPPEQQQGSRPALTFLDWLQRYANLNGLPLAALFRPVELGSLEQNQNLLDAIRRITQDQGAPLSDYGAMVQQVRQSLEAVPPEQLAQAPQGSFAQYLTQNNQNLANFLFGGLRDTVRKQNSVIQHVIQHLRQQFGIPPTGPTGTGASRIQ